VARDLLRSSCLSGDERCEDFEGYGSRYLTENNQEEFELPNRWGAYFIGE
jgi:hypothetical protein